MEIKDLFLPLLVSLPVIGFAVVLFVSFKKYSTVIEAHNEHIKKSFKEILK